MAGRTKQRVQNVELRFGADGATLKEYLTDDDSRVVAIRGPLGSGKTFTSCQKIMRCICKQRPNQAGVRKSRWVAVRNTYPDLTGTTIKDWMELFGDTGIGKLNKDFPPTFHMDFMLPDKTRVKAELVFLALDRPDSVRKLRGLQVTGFWLNEMKELDKEIVDMCDARHGRYPSALDGGPSWHGMIGDTNSPDEDHWYYELAEVTKPKNWRFLTQPGGVLRTGFNKWEPNPNAENLRFLPEGYYDTMVEGKDPDWVAVNLANEYGMVKAGKPIYENQYNPQLHLSKDLYNWVPRHKDSLIMGVDFGLTPSVIIGQLMPSGQLRILHELVAERMGIEAFADEVLIPFFARHFPSINRGDVPMMCDPSGVRDNDTDQKSAIGILVEKGFDAMPAMGKDGKPTNNPVARWEAVRHFLTRLVDGGQPAFSMSRDIRILHKGFLGGYHYKRLNVSGTKKYSDKADKNEYSHPHDALQYLCLGVLGYMLTQNTPLPFQQSRPAADSLTGY